MRCTFKIDGICFDFKNRVSAFCRNFGYRTGYFRRNSVEGKSGIKSEKDVCGNKTDDYVPGESSEMFGQYNALQKSQGYDLEKYSGKTVMRYVYRVNNYPNATEPVYASVLVYKNKIIGGDITNTAPNGTMQGLLNPES